jgi:hypothetical protein
MVHFSVQSEKTNIINMNKSLIIATLLVIVVAVIANNAEVSRVVNIPSGAPPTNDGYAYSQLAYNKVRKQHLC